MAGFRVGSVLAAFLALAPGLPAQAPEDEEPLPSGLPQAREALPITPAEVLRVIEYANPLGIAVRELPRQLSRAEIGRIQVALAERGFDPGTREGELDAATAEALRAFQQSRGLAPCGCVSYETVTELGIPVVIVLRLANAGDSKGTRRVSAAEAGPEGEVGGRSSNASAEGYEGAEPWAAWSPVYPVLFHQRVEFLPPEDGEGAVPSAEPRGAGTTSGGATGDRAVRPPGVRPAPPPRTAPPLPGRMAPRRSF
ncbi:MAG: peptidoglycan-binding protein [Gemmatimonadota bacterium]